MKLNNQGWGYKTMILLMSILITFLLVAVYFIYRFYDSIQYTNGIKIEIVEKL